MARPERTDCTTRHPWRPQAGVPGHMVGLHDRLIDLNRLGMTDPDP